MRDTRFKKFPPTRGGFSAFPSKRNNSFGPGSQPYTPRPRTPIYDPLEKEFPRNHAISAPEVRVLMANGESIGVMSTKDAITRAEEEEVDLVLIAPLAKPPVCKLIAWESFRYQHKKKEKELKKKQKVVKLKEIKISPKISPQGLNRKVEKIHEVTTKGDQAKITIMRRWPVTEEAARKFKDDLLTKLDESCIINVQEKGKNIYILVKSK